jgi:RHS repeat-associated protein
MMYDANNRLTNMVDAVGSTAYRYTDFGALLSEDGPWDDDKVTYGYTTNRLRSKLSLLQPNASDWEVSYGYDAASRLTSVISPAGSFNYTLRSAGSLPAKLSLPNGAYVTNTYDALGRLTGTCLKNSSHNLLNAHEYALDEASRRTNQVRIVTGTNVTAAPITNFVAYTYDKIGQLKTAIGKESGGTARWHERFGYAYDDANNLSYRTNNIFRHTFSTDNQNQLTSITRSGTYTVAGTTWGPATNVTVAANGGAATAAIRYADATFARTNVTLLNGTNTFTAVAADGLGRWDTNTIKAYLPSTVSFKYDGNGNLRTNGTRIFDYDDENQLIMITEPNAWRSHFAYDGKMRRRVRTECTWNGGAWVTNLIVRYVCDANLVVQERHFNPQLSTQTPFNSITYTRGRDLSGSLEGAGGIGGMLARSDDALSAIGDAGAHASYQSDGNGNVTALINDRQAIVARYFYDPFGNPLSAIGPLAEANLFRFSSKELHTPSGLIYYGRRFYGPHLQRWLRRDPIGEKGGHNLFVFCGNRPISAFDPFGLEWQWWKITKKCCFDVNPFTVIQDANAAETAGWNAANASFDPNSNEHKAMRHCVAMGNLAASQGCKGAACLGTQREIWQNNHGGQ